MQAVALLTDAAQATIGQRIHARDNSKCYITPEAAAATRLQRRASLLPLPAHTRCPLRCRTGCKILPAVHSPDYMGAAIRSALPADDA